MTESTERTGLWDAMVPEDAVRYGADILDPEARRRWCTAVFVGGLPYLWQRVAQVPATLALDRLELREGDRVLVFGEAVEGIGFDRLVRERVGTTGTVEVIDIRHQVLDMVREERLAQWEWREAANFADEEFDVVFVAQAVAHAGDWAREGRELLRVMKSGRRIVLAEISMSDTFRMRAAADVHLQYWVRKLLEGMGMPEFDDLANWPQQALIDAFRPLLPDLETFEWRGVELLWGRKP